MIYQIQLDDTVASEVMPTLNVPLEESVIEGVSDVTTLDLNLYTDFFATKRVWTHTWSYMTEAEFNTLKGFYDRQWSLFQYPSLTIDTLSVDGVIVRMELSPQRIIDKCGTVENVQVVFRETVQMSQDWFISSGSGSASS